MALEDALRVLGEPANQQINWTFGDLIRERALRQDWRECPLLRQLETNRNLDAWNELCRRTRESLADEADLPRKARTLLKPRTSLFDQSLDDFIAEMLAAMYLSRLSHTGITFPSEEDTITADLISVHNGHNYITEAKNLREPNSLAFVAFARWHYNRSANPEAFNFKVEFLKIDDPFEDLTKDQAAAIRNLIDELHRRRRPLEFQTTLPDNRAVRVRIADGSGAMLQHGPGPFLVNELSEECQRAVILKLLDPARKALAQLYAPAVPTDYRRLLFFRWKPPDAVVAIAEADDVRTVIRDRCQAFIRQFFPNFALAIVHTQEDIEHTPLVDW